METRRARRKWRLARSRRAAAGVALVLGASLLLTACSGVQGFGLSRDGDGQLEIIGGCTASGVTRVQVRTDASTGAATGGDLRFSLDYVGAVEDAPTRVLLAEPGPEYAVSGTDVAMLSGPVIVSVNYARSGLIGADLVVDLDELTPGAFVEARASGGGDAEFGSLDDYLDDRGRCRLDLQPLLIGAAVVLVALVILAVVLTRWADRRERRAAPPAPPPPPTPQTSSLPPPPARR